MDPRDYTGKEWTDLLRQMSTRQIRNSLKRAYRKEANKAQRIAAQKLRTSGLKYSGSDMEKGIRTRIYSRGGGFMLTVKAKKATKSGGKEQGMYTNRQGLKKPVLMWAEEGTLPRRTKSATKFFVRTRKGHSTGQMPSYGFMEKATPQMYKSVEDGLFPEIDLAVRKVAKKAGFI